MTTIKQFFGSESWQQLRDLKLPREGKSVGLGVCVAFGKATPLAAWMWRVLFCVTTLAWGFGLIAYLILWVSIPNEGDAA